MTAKFIPALQRSRNFFELYQYICGRSEVPPVYHFWSSVSLMAAVLEGNVWFEKHADEKLYPNIYVFLIGPPALGKGTAISMANRLADRSVVMPRYRGSATDASLIDVLGKIEKDDYGRKILANPHLWLVMDELKNNLGTNPQRVEAFLSLMTELFTATGYTLNTSTRKYGKIDIIEPIVNWLIGTTEGDLRGLISRKLVDSGFVSRVCFIFGDYNFNIRYPRIIYPPDRDEVIEHLRNRLWILQQTRGPLTMTPEAEALQDKWYKTRPSPEDETLYATWKRQHDMLLKFAQYCCLADAGPMVIRSVHLSRAKSMVKSVEGYASRLLEVVNETFDTKPSNDIAEFIKKRGEMDHSSCLRYFRAKKGMNAKRFREAVFGLVQEGTIESGRSATGAIIYKWKG